MNDALGGRSCSQSTDGLYMPTPGVIDLRTCALAGSDDLKADDIAVPSLPQL